MYDRVEHAATMRTSPLWSRLALGCLLWSVPAVSFAQGPQTQGQPQPTTILAPDEETTIFTPDDETAELEEEVGDRDLTYLRTRLVYRYDHKQLEVPVSGCPPSTPVARGGQTTE